MLVLRCTTKLLAALALDAGELPSQEDDPTLGSWFVNMFPLQRRRGLLFTHSTTLYSVFAYPIKLAALAEILSGHPAHYLQLDEFPPAQIRGLLAAYQDHVFAVTNNRRVLGSMNDQRIQIEAFATIHGVDNPLGIAVVNRAINRNPLSMIKYSYPTDRMKGLLSDART